MTNNDASVPEPMDFDTWRMILEESLEAEPEPPIRRKVRRYSVHGPCSMHYEYRRMRRCLMLNLTNVSLGGIMGKCAEEIAMDTEIELHLPVEDRLFSVKGTIIHCTNTLGGYKVGVEFVFPRNSTGASRRGTGVSGSAIFRPARP